VLAAVGVGVEPADEALRRRRVPPSAGRTSPRRCTRRARGTRPIRPGGRWSATAPSECSWPRSGCGALARPAGSHIRRW